MRAVAAADAASGAPVEGADAMVAAVEMVAAAADAAAATDAQAGTGIHTQERASWPQRALCSRK